MVYSVLWICGLFCFHLLGLWSRRLSERRMHRNRPIFRKYPVLIHRYLALFWFIKLTFRSFLESLWKKETSSLLIVSFRWIIPWFIVLKVRCSFVKETLAIFTHSFVLLGKTSLIKRLLFMMFNVCSIAQSAYLDKIIRWMLILADFDLS